MYVTGPGVSQPLVILLYKTEIYVCHTYVLSYFKNPLEINAFKIYEHFLHSNISFTF